MTKHGPALANDEDEEKGSGAQQSPEAENRPQLTDKKNRDRVIQL